MWTKRLPSSLPPWTFPIIIYTIPDSTDSGQNESLCWAGIESRELSQVWEGDITRDPGVLRFYVPYGDQPATVPVWLLEDRHHLLCTNCQPYHSCSFPGNFKISSFCEQWILTDSAFWWNKLVRTLQLENNNNTLVPICKKILTLVTDSAFMVKLTRQNSTEGNRQQYTRINM